jgi:amidase
MMVEGNKMTVRLLGKYIFSFSKNNPAVLRVSSGETVEINTLDCFSNQLQGPKDTLESMDWERVNPATGPVFVEGAQPGDVLKVTVQDIKLAEQGVMAAGKGLGVLGHLLEGLQSKLIPISEGKAVFDSKLEIPLNPMIGVIGVAPENEGVNCGTPGSHGGNMDNLMITTGAVLYLPVYVEGALFALGDLHAAMGDGEIGVTGVETSGTVTVTLEVVKGLKINNPVLENKDSFTTIASRENLEEAVKAAAEDMACILENRIPLAMSELAMLMSAVGHTQICQVVDPLRTARFVMPKWVLERYKFSFI